MLLPFPGKNIYWMSSECYVIQPTLSIFLQINHAASHVRIQYHDNTITCELFTARA